MNIGNVLGSLQLAQQHPQLIQPFIVHILHRSTHTISKKSNGQVHAPEQITVVVTDKCNLHCKMCQYAYSSSPGYHLNQNGHMQPSLFRKLMDELQGHPIISFTGGEPLLNRHLETFIAGARHKGCLTTLTTNGWLLEQRADSLCAAGLDVLIVSVDGQEDVHDSIRGAKSFSHLAAGLQAIQQHKQRPLLMLNMTISNLNDDQLIKVYELAKAWHVDGLNFNHLWMQTEEMINCLHEQFPHFETDEIAWDVQPTAVNVALLASQLAAIRRLNRKELLLVTELPWLNHEQIATWYQDPARFVKYESTRCAWTRMKIWPNGDVKPCREWVAGNVAEENLMAIWHGEAFRNFRELLAKHKTIPICSRCCYMTYR
jgi:MoaA/NifB/PqqE/SkfB family radical SAM enzyme